MVRSIRDPESFPGLDVRASRESVSVSDNREFIGEFLIESAENLDQLDRDLVALEADPRDADCLASIFRTVHTIKGTCGFFGFTKLGGLTHHGEHLLGRLRDGRVPFEECIADALLELVDAIRQILQSIEQSGEEGSADFTDLAARLDGLASGKATVDPAPATSVEAAATAPNETRADPASPSGAENMPQAVLPEPDHQPAPSVTSGLEAHAAGVSPSPAVEVTQPEPRAASRANVPVESTIRVDVALLDSMVDLVGELVLARNQLRAAVTDDPLLASAVNRIHAVTGSLQEAAMKTRMQPIEQLFSRFPRIVRDVASTCGKQVVLEIDGADTELDRTLVESIRDPLTHLIRNAIDHGIEPAEQRLTVGKPAAGRLSLRAFHESGQVTIEVEDDGGGIGVDAVRAKAVARGLVTAEMAATMPDERVFQFIFEPGFSTARQVTDVSGRGVGMDVVRTNIEAIGGTVDISSRQNAGTVVRVRIPLTLAIIPALIVTSGGERLAIPQVYVRELLAIRPDGETDAIEGLANAPVVRLRDRLLPVVFMDRWLGLREWEERPRTGTVVVVGVDDYEFGLVVDTITTNDETRAAAVETAGLWTIVVKPIGSLLAPLGLYAGATVMGDGGVVLILDLRGLAMAADVPARTRSVEARLGGVEKLPPAVIEPQRYLVCETRRGRRVAMPLSAVSRLESVHADAVTRSGGRQFVRRGNDLARVIDLDCVLGAETPMPEPEPMVGVVLAAESAGDLVAVRRIVDVCSSDGLLRGGRGEGVLGSLLLEGVATDVIDVSVAAASLAQPGCR